MFDGGIVERNRARIWVHSERGNRYRAWKISQWQKTRGQEMKKLLEDLKKLDHETWDKIQQLSQHYTIYDEIVLRFIIQGEIQIAIAERGWGLVLQSEMWMDRNQFSADICDEDANDIGDAEGDSYVGAILTAYLAAIGADQCPS
jgi:hypothetical protein